MPRVSVTGMRAAVTGALGRRQRARRFRKALVDIAVGRSAARRDGRESGVTATDIRVSNARGQHNDIRAQQQGPFAPGVHTLGKETKMEETSLADGDLTRLAQRFVAETCGFLTENWNVQREWWPLRP